MAVIDYKTGKHCDNAGGNYGRACRHLVAFKPAGGIFDQSFFMCSEVRKRVLLLPEDADKVNVQIEQVLVPDDCPIIFPPVKELF